MSADDEDASTLGPMLKTLHVKLSGWVNKLDDAVGRKVWFQYRETQLTYQKSYLARLSYVHRNAVKHGLVKLPSEYPWCSAGWLERVAEPAKVKTLYRIKTDKLNVEDEFPTSDDW